VGSRKTSAGTRYRNTDASPNTAIVGAERRLATDPVVIMARAVHVMNVGFLTVAVSVAAVDERPAVVVGRLMELMAAI
jgi:hypothetical protein